MGRSVASCKACSVTPAWTVATSVTAHPSADCIPVDADFINEFGKAPFVGEQLAYAGEESYGFARVVAGECVCMVWFWFGERYRTRNFWPLQEREAKLVHVTTRSDHRGAGHAPFLIEDSAARLRRQGFECLYARIWHSNHPSIRAFSKAGWQKSALVCQIRPFGRLGPLRWTRRYSSATQ